MYQLLRQGYSPDLHQNGLVRHESCAMTKLNVDQLTTALERLPQWKSSSDTIRRIYQFSNFVRAVAFVNRVAEIAEAANHHPDIDIRYNKVTIALSTHDEGGVTEKDIDEAGKIEAASKQRG